LTKIIARMPTSRTTPAETKITDLQPKCWIASRSGTCAVSAPILPKNSPSPESIANRRAGNQCVASFSSTSQPTAVAPPMIARPAQASAKSCVESKKNAPIPAVIEPQMSSLRAPHESTRIPVGICIAT
jgi:hypothetical protein